MLKEQKGSMHCMCAGLTPRTDAGKGQSLADYQLVRSFLQATVPNNLVAPNHFTQALKCFASCDTYKDTAAIQSWDPWIVKNICCGCIFEPCFL
jgi:hypothetical protein